MNELDVDGGIPGATIPTRFLEGDESARYVKTLVAVFRAARLNDQWPDARRLAEHVSALAPEVHGGLYRGVEADVRSGLPSYKEWTRVQTDSRLAPDTLRQLGPRAALAAKAAKAGSDSIHAKLLAKHDYSARLAKLRLAPLGDMKVNLRRLDPDRREAAFHVILDKLDVSGVFVRYSIDLVQRDEFWTQSAVVLDEEAARHTESFRSLVYKFTSYDAEFTFVKLATAPNLTVERVVKGVVGPICFPWVESYERLRSMIGPDQVVANFSLDMASIDLTADRDNDPLEDLVLERLGAEARAGYEHARRRYGYKVFKDRKFVCSRALLGQVRSLCSAEGTKNIVYTI